MSETACKYCGHPTLMTGTKMCDSCWELERRIQGNPEIAKRILALSAVGSAEPVINQCDGCRRASPVKLGVHYENGLLLMVCTADRYPPRPALSEERIRQLAIDATLQGNGIRNAYVERSCRIAVRVALRESSAGERDASLPARVLAMCKKRGWSLHWAARGVYLHLEASELIEALRGKRGDPVKEAADVLIVLQSITE